MSLVVMVVVSGTPGVRDRRRRNGKRCHAAVRARPVRSDVCVKGVRVMGWDDEPEKQRSAAAGLAGYQAHPGLYRLVRD
jgi:hypothetical protein